MMWAKAGRILYILEIEELWNQKMAIVKVDEFKLPRRLLKPDEQRLFCIKNAETLYTVDR